MRLRRQAAGIVQIMLAHGLSCRLKLFDLSLAVHARKNDETEAAEIRKII